MNERLYNVEEAAEFFKVSTKTIHKFIKERTLTGFKAGRDWRFTRGDLEQGIERLRAKTDTDKHRAVTPPKKGEPEVASV